MAIFICIMFNAINLCYVILCYYNLRGDGAQPHPYIMKQTQHKYFVAIYQKTQSERQQIAKWAVV